MIIRFTVNHEKKEMDVVPEKRLLDFIRDDLGLKGTKEGCGIGECGACTVILNGSAIHACLTMTGQLDGGELLTVEGLEKDGTLSMLQEMFIKHSAVQCGFCTAGMLMSATALLMKNPCPTDDDIRMALAGNICRCTGYREIRAAVKAASLADAAGKEADA